MRKLVGPLVSTQKLSMERLLYESMRIERLNYLKSLETHACRTKNSKPTSASKHSELLAASHFLAEDASKVNYELAKRLGLSEERIIELERKAYDDACERMNTYIK